jgi:hypothetical protein
VLEALGLVTILLITFPVIGVVTRRWYALVLPLVGWPIFYEGVHRGWWLYGTGDGWQVARTLLTTVGVATTAFAVLVARRLGPIAGDEPTPG